MMPILLGLAIGGVILWLGHLSIVLLTVSIGIPIIFSSVLVGTGKLRKLIQSFEWWHGLWLFAFLSGLVFRIRDTQTSMDSPLDMWALYRIGLVSLVGFTLLYRLVTRQPDWLHSICKGLVGLLAAYAGFGLLSTGWSGYPSWTLYKSVEYLVDVSLIAAVLVSVRDVKDMKVLFNWNWVLLSLHMGSAWLGTILWPEQAVRHDVGAIGIQILGVYPAIETNGVGQLAAILGIVALSRIILSDGEKKFYVIGFGITMVTLILAQSRSPLTGFLLAIPVVLFAAKKIGGVTILALGLSGLLLLTPAVEPFWEFFQRGQDEEEFAGLSGRMEMWEMGLSLVQDRPLTGHGAYAGSRFTGVTDRMKSGASSVLNTWIEVLLGVGVPGFLLFVMAFVGTWLSLARYLLRSTHDPVARLLAIEGIGALTVLSVRTMFSSQLIWHPPLTFLLVLGFAEFLRRTNAGSDRSTQTSHHVGIEAASTRFDGVGGISDKTT